MSLDEAFGLYGRSARWKSLRGKKVEKSGYIVPVPVVQHFLDDIKKGNCGGVPSLGAYWQRIENSSLRGYLGMKEDESGVLVTRPCDRGPHQLGRVKMAFGIGLCGESKDRRGIEDD